MEIWNYHPVTGEFIAKTLADESPLEPGAYLIPAHATTVPAPEETREGFVIVFNGTEWIYEEDHRGETWWDKDGNKYIIDVPGKPNTEILSTEPPVVPEPVIKELTPEEKLQASGLTVDELKQLLGLK